MPRRKQGQTARETTGGNQKKKSDIKLIHNEAPKPNKNDLVFKIKKTLSSTTFCSTPNGKAQREHVGASKSLNENTVVSQPEVNNNSIRMQKSNRISKSEKLNHVVTTNHVKESSVDVTSPIVASPVKVDVITCLSPVTEKSTLPIDVKVHGIRGISKPSSDTVYQNSVITCNKESVTNKFLKLAAISTANVKSAQDDSVEPVDSQFKSKNKIENSDMSECSVEKQDVDRGTQMSGVSPLSPDVRNNSESHKLNYRVSTSVTVNKTGISNSSFVKDDQNCQLPSSVYGTPASSIEKVLNGLQVSEKADDSISVGKISFLQEILEKEGTDRIPYHTEQEQKKEKTNVCKNKFQELNKVAPVIRSASVDDSLKNISSNSDSDKDMNVENTNRSKFKIHIPELLNNDDSSSSLFSSETQKVIKFPKITSPQILEQHISKIISENAAIVDTFDPPWSKRYLKISTSQNQDFETKKQGTVIKLVHSNILDSSNSSKLQSALLGGSENDFKNVSQSLSSTSNPISTSSFSKARPFSQFSSLPNSKTSTLVSEEELQGSAIKSLLSLKQGRYSKQKNAFCFDNNDAYDQHPQNPEGSIIKDLLLKTKANEDQRSDKDNQNKTLYNTTFVSESSFSLSKASALQHKCPHCSTEFSDQHILNEHVLICKNSETLSFVKNSSVIPVTNAQTKSVISEHRKNSVSKNNIYDGLKSSTDDGPILKKQLLLPLSSSPPVKRRKISEPVLTSDETIAQQNMNDFSGVSHKPNLIISPQRQRSQSVHLFGGEVQILDGMKMKKIKIKTRIQGAFSSNNIYNYPLQTSPDIENEKYSTSLPAVIVTIAQPVHNSGGTVTHVPVRKQSSHISPIGTLSSGIITDTDSIIKGIKTENGSGVDSVTEQLSENSSIVSYPFLPGPESTSQSSIHCSQSFSSSKANNFLIGPLSSDSSPMSFKLGLSPDHSKPFYSPIFIGSDKSPFDTTASNSKVSNAGSTSIPIVPSVLLTPSSPTVQSSENNCTSEPGNKFLAPMRPTSLPLKKKPFTMVGSTLISPETPRPKKSCVQMYLNGHAYTYLGLKCSTRSTYCCIYRPQPMFVLQETNPKLSMYSNWQVVPAKEELSGLTPGQMISYYCSNQNNGLHGITTTAKLGEPLTFTHSSYWTYRSQEHDTTVHTDTNMVPMISIANDAATEDSMLYDDEEKDNIAISATALGLPQRSETVITTTPVNSLESQVHSTDESSQRLDTDNTLSDDLDGNISNEDDDDCSDDGNGSLTDSSQPQPPKRVKIFEGGFKSNEDYTYVRGRGRGKYVCEECGIRCKKPSMLKKHIRTHTDLRPYKCRHCSFAFKTKGNLTKHMKSKAHHKKCTELGIVPVPTTTDDSQVDEEALAKQIEKKKTQFSDGEDADDDDDDDCSDESEDECESDTSMMASNLKQKCLANGQSKKSVSSEKSASESLDESFQSKYDASAQQLVEQEAARSLLHLSALGEPSQWSTSTGDLTDVTSCEAETGLLISTQAHNQFPSPAVSTIVLPGSRSKVAAEQAMLSWIPTETMGHRPRSYSADIPSSGSNLARYRLAKNSAVESAGNISSIEDAEFGSREPYTRRYSISVAREARKPKILHPPEWDRLTSKWPDLDSDQPMDLSISRDLGKSAIYGQGPSLLSVVMQEEAGLDADLPIHLDTESYPIKSLPVLSPQVLREYEAGADNNADVGTMQQAEEFSGGNPNRSVYYMPNITTPEGTATRKESDITDDPASPVLSDYGISSPVSPTALDEGSYYYGQESTALPISTQEEPSANSRFHAEFIVPSTSSSMEDGKCVCRICNKIFAKSSHLRLHVNIHYFERPFRCDNCAVSFRTKGHLQKHKRSVSHYNKVNMNLTFGTPTVDNPRPFKCADCKIAFRIHGHLAKHLRSKMHIMKLECLGKLPFGMYAEMERSGVSLNEIDTTDCNNSLESLQVMAQKLYQRDPRRMRWQGTEQIPPEIDQSKIAAATTIEPIVEPLGVAFNVPIVSSHAVATPQSDAEEVKREPSEIEAFRSSAGVFPSDPEGVTSNLSQYLINAVPVQQPSRDVAAHKSDDHIDPAISLHRSGTCHICGRLFKSAKFLQVHLYSDHPTANPSSVNAITSSNTSAATQGLDCDLCGRQFPSQKVLQQHLLSHVQPRPFVCEVCDAGFTSSASLIAHKATHQSPSSSSATSSRLVQLQ